MSAGLQIINDSGVVIIDENYPNLVLSSKGTVTTTGTYYAGGSGYAAFTIYSSSFTVSATTPMVALYCSAGPVSGSCAYANGVWTVTIYSAFTARTVEWYLFDKPQTVGGSGVGLQVFDASGVCVFTSSSSSCTILDYYQLLQTTVVANGGIGSTIARSVGNGSQKIGTIIGNRLNGGLVIGDFGESIVYGMSVHASAPGTAILGFIPIALWGSGRPKGSGYWMGDSGNYLFVNLDGL